MYKLVVLPKSKAAKAIQELQPPARKKFWDHIELLKTSPFEYSERAGFYAPKKGQLYKFKFTISGVRYYFQIVFKFSDTRDENTLLVADITFREIF